jgi:hypothetical protein
MPNFGKFGNSLYISYIPLTLNPRRHRQRFRADQFSVVVTDSKVTVKVTVYTEQLQKN